MSLMTFYVALQISERTWQSEVLAYLSGGVRWSSSVSSDIGIRLLHHQEVQPCDSVQIHAGHIQLVAVFVKQPDPHGFPLARLASSVIIMIHSTIAQHLTTNRSLTGKSTN